MKKIDYAALLTLRKDGYYQGHYYDGDGKRHSVSGKDAEQVYKKIQRLSGKGGSQERTFREVAEEWQAVHREEIGHKTWVNYSRYYNDIVDTHGKKLITEVDPLDVAQDLKRAKAQGYSRTVVNSRRSVYRMIFDYAIAQGYIRYNPVASVKLPKNLPQSVRKAPTDEQIKTIICNRDIDGGFLPFFLLCTGMRKSEALALTWADIDFNAGIINCNKSLEYIGAQPRVKPPKTEAGVRQIPIIPQLLKALKTAHNGSQSKLVFPKPRSNKNHADDEYYTERAFEGEWERYLNRVGLVGDKRLTAHQLRHGTATLLFEANVDEKTTQKILGHSRIEITRDIYTELREKHEKANIDKFADELEKYTK